MSAGVNLNRQEQTQQYDPFPAVDWVWHVTRQTKIYAATIFQYSTVGICFHVKRDWNDDASCSDDKKGWSGVGQSIIRRGTRLMFEIF